MKASGPLLLLAAVGGVIASSPLLSPPGIQLESVVEWNQYPSFAALVSNSTHVLLGVVSEISFGERSGVAVTYGRITVTEAWKGNSTSDISVIQTGGLSDSGGFVGVLDDPAIGIGERSIFFLKFINETDPVWSLPLASIRGGPQGRVMVIADLAYSMDTVDQDADWIPVKYRAEDLSRIREAVQNA